MSRPVLVIEGEIFSELSLSRVNRELALALLRTGEVELGINAPLAGPYLHLAPTAPLRGRVGATLSRPPDLFLRHRWPPDFTRPRWGRYLHMQPWEYGELPLAWLDPVRENVDEVLCYTRYVRDLYARAGIPDERLSIVPLGVDPATFTPDGPARIPPTRGSFRFLFLGGTIWRKGADLAINAYLNAFRPGDDVALIVKDVGSKSSYKGQGIGEQVRALAACPDVPEIVYLDETYDDATLAALYRGVDVVVHPYRGEGFGLPVLEAMACGTPAIVTDGGATDDFIDATSGIRVAAERVPIQLAEALCAPGWALEIPVERLAAIMRAVAERPDAVRALGANAARRVHADFTWDRSAARLLEHALVAR